MTSASHWPVNRIRVPAPDGWFVKQSWTLLAPDGQANIIVSCEPLAPHLDTGMYAASQARLLRGEFPGYHELDETWIQLAAGPAVVRIFGWQPPDGVAVVQHQLYWVEPGTGYTATGTVSRAQYQRYRPVFDDVFPRLRFGATGEPPGVALN